MKLLQISTCLLGLLAFACSPESDRGDRPLVVTTTTMVSDLVRQLGGDRIEVRGLMGPKIDPHSYVPKLADTALLEDADLILYSGLHLEGRMQASMKAMAKRGRAVIAVAESIPDDRLLAPQEDFEGTKDPHVWGDPNLWMLTVEPVVEALATLDPEHAEEYRQRGEAYQAELQRLSAWAMERLAEVPADRRILVTSHDAFFYFGRAFDFQVRGLQGVSTAAETGLGDRAKLVEFLKAQGVPTVFPETSINSKGIAAVAAEAGVRVSPGHLFSDALGAPGDIVEVRGETYDRGTYVGMLKHNINTIVIGLTQP